MIRKTRNKAKEAPDGPEITANPGLDARGDVPMIERVLFEGSPLPVAALAGPKHILRYVNTAFCRLADKAKDDLIGEPFAEVVFWEGCLALLGHVCDTGEAVVHTEPEGTEAHPVGRSYTM